jgi:hypothetical protein
MLIAVVFVVLALAFWFPETRIGGALRRWLIDAPVRGLDRLKRGHFLFALLILTALAAAYAIGREAGVLVAGQAAADGVAYAMVFDLATWLDVMAIALAIAATVRLRETIRFAVLQARRLARRCAGAFRTSLAPLARSRARRSRPTPRPRRGEDPDRPAPAFGWDQACSALSAP